MFSSLASLALAVAALTQTTDSDRAESSRNDIVSHAFGKTYTSHIDLETLNDVPLWNEDEGNPPVSVRQALKLADRMMRRVAKAPDGWTWRPTNLHLFLGEEPRAWTVMYQAIPTEPTGEEPVALHEVRLMVLFDGTVVQPVVADENPDAVEGVKRSRGLD